MIDLSGLASIAGAMPDQLSSDCLIAPENLAFVSGGTRLREIVEWARADGREKSIPTSGTHLGPTIAGGFGTASHGSRLGYGGLQNLVRAIHLVTGPNPSDAVWIERSGEPILRRSLVESALPGGLIQNDAIFEDVLIHLGAMGVINGVVIELSENTGFNSRIVEKSIDETWLKLLSDGDFSAIGSGLNLKGNMAFYELTIDPFAWNKTPAIHNVYLKNADAPTAELHSGDLAIPDALALAIQGSGPNGRAEDDATDLDPVKIFEKYRGVLMAWDQETAPRNNVAWADLHPDEITGGLPGMLWNASFAIDQSQLASALPAICEAVKHLKWQTFLFTVRFVHDAAGTLAFTRFDNCAVIEIDGISDKAFRLPPQYGEEIVEGSRLVREALDKHKIDYSMHWAKLGGKDKTKVHRDFGSPNDTMSRLGRWTETREFLLEPTMRKLFWNQAIVDLGLVDAS
ncbi:MAG: hypothetical protein ABJ205_01720 [Erythrobacter sp.]